MLGLTVQQASHADVGGNVFNDDGQHGILVVGNSRVNLADSAIRLFEQPDTTTAERTVWHPMRGERAYVAGPLGSLSGRSVTSSFVWLHPLLEITTDQTLPAHVRLQSRATVRARWGGVF